MAKNSVIAILTVALGLFLSAGPVLAQPEEIKSAREDFILSAEKLNEAKDADLAPEARAKRELGIKRVALEKIINFSILETRDIKKRVENFTEIEAELLILQDDFLAKLEDHLDYLTVAENILKISADLNAVQKLAADLNDWRESVYNPEIKKIMDFALTFQNKALLKIADQRFAKMAIEFKKIKAAKANPALWLNLLGEAALNLKEAREAQSGAAQLLLDYLPKPKATPTRDQLTDEEGMEKPEPSETPEPSAKPTIRDLVARSLLKIKNAYGNFIELNDLAKKISK